jgi:hypothetical protein
MGLLLKKPADEPGAAWPAIAVGLFVAFGGILFGYCLTLLLSHTIADLSIAMTPAQSVAYWA